MGTHHESRDHNKQSRRQKRKSHAARAAGHSDPGCERETNEDRFLIFMADDIAGYFVFDGMGGQPAGDAAAQISSDVIYDSLALFEAGDLTDCMTTAIESAQEAVVSRGENPELAGMGTTVVGVLTRDDEIVIAAVGDSRAYHITLGSVQQVTCDHTLVQQLVDAGQISPHDALVHPQSHILTRCLGSRLDFAVDARLYRLVECAKAHIQQEWLLLCSDGLYSLVTEEELQAIVVHHSPEKATRTLISVARSRGGFDNITALIVPLPGRMIEQSDVGQHTPADAGVPAEPEEFLSASDIGGADSSGIVCRRHVWKRCGAVVFWSALAVIVSLILLASFTKV